MVFRREEIAGYIHDVIIHILCIPLYLYYIGMHFGNEILDMNHRLRDWYFLKRIRMTSEEFDEFLKYKMEKK